jgi:hypothetical protein
VSKTLAICATVAFCVLIGAFVFLTYQHIDTTSLVTFAIGMLSGIAPNIANYMKTHAVANDVQVVKEQTNGPLTRAMEQINKLTQTVQEIQDHQHGEGQ